MISDILLCRDFDLTREPYTMRGSRLKHGWFIWDKYLYVIVFRFQYSEGNCFYVLHFTENTTTQQQKYK